MDSYPSGTGSPNKFLYRLPCHCFITGVLSFLSLERSRKNDRFTNTECTGYVLFSIFASFIHVHLCLWCVWACGCGKESWFPPTVWVLRTELRLSDLAAGIFTHWAVLPALLSVFWDKSKLGVVAGSHNPSMQEIWGQPGHHIMVIVRLASNSPLSLSEVTSVCYHVWDLVGFSYCFLLKDSSFLEGWLIPGLEHKLYRMFAQQSLSAEK